MLREEGDRPYYCQVPGTPHGDLRRPRTTTGVVGRIRPPALKIRVRDGFETFGATRFLQWRNELGLVDLPFRKRIRGERLEWRAKAQMAEGADDRPRTEGISTFVCGSSRRL